MMCPFFGEFCFFSYKASSSKMMVMNGIDGGVAKDVDQ